MINPGPVQFWGMEQRTKFKSLPQVPAICIEMWLQRYDYPKIELYTQATKSLLLVTRATKANIESFKSTSGG